jgi:hypothetical protein
MFSVTCGREKSQGHESKRGNGGREGIKRKENKKK